MPPVTKGILLWVYDLGYSADDPPVRYLLEGLALSSQIKEHRLYAFAAGDAPITEAIWRDRGVTAVSYDPEDGHKHLWDSIDAWAERAREPTRWRDKIVGLASAPPQSLRPFERGQVAALCSSQLGAQAFAAATPPRPAEWLCVFDAHSRYWKPGKDFRGLQPSSSLIDPLDYYGLDDDPKRIEGRPDDQQLGLNLLAPLTSDSSAVRENALLGHREFVLVNPRLFQFVRWICNVMHSPTTVWWAARHTYLNSNLREQLSWRLISRGAEFDPVIRKAWRLTLEAKDGAESSGMDGWDRIEQRIANEGWTSSTIRALATATRPKLSVKDRYSRAPRPPEVPPTSLSDIAHFGVDYPKLIQDVSLVPDSDLITVTRIARNNLIYGAILELEIDHHSSRLPTLNPEKRAGIHHYSDAEAYYIEFSNIFVRLKGSNPKAAIVEFKSWEEKYRFFVPLRIWALADPSLSSSAECGRALRALPQDVFWHFDHSRDILCTIKARWPGLSQHDRAALERKILNGRKKFEFEKQSEYSTRKRHGVAERLTWMRLNNLEINQSTINALYEVTRLIPSWKDEWAAGADKSHESRAGWVKRETDPTAISNLPIKEVVPRCDELAKSEILAFTEFDPFRGLVVSQPHRAMVVLLYEGRRNCYPHKYWSRLLDAWPDSAGPRRNLLLAKALSKVPLGLLVSVRYEATRWLQHSYKEIYGLNTHIAHLCFDHIIDALESGAPETFKSGMGQSSVGGAEIPTNFMGINYAINAPTGHMAEGIIEALFAHRVMLAGQTIPTDFTLRLERLLNLPGEGGWNALTILSQQLTGLYGIDPDWTKRFLIPCLDPQCGVAEAAWAGFLGADYVTVDLFRETKRHFLAAFPAAVNWTADGLSHLGGRLVLAFDPPEHYGALLTYGEARTAMHDTTPEIRNSALFLLRDRAKQPEKWEQLITPFFKKIWPREQKYQTATTTANLIQLLAESGDHFPSAIRLVSNYLIPLAHPHLHIFTATEDKAYGRAGLTARFPYDVLLLAIRVIDGNVRSYPYELPELLVLLARAEPQLQHDAGWQRLHKLTLE